MPAFAIVLLLAELSPGLLGGYLLGQYKPEWFGPLARPRVRFGVPLSLMGLLLKVVWNTSLLSMAPPNTTVIMVLLLVLRGWSQRLNQLMSSTLQLGTCIGNTAYLGITDAVT